MLIFALPRETLQLQTLHYIIQLIANYYETMTMEKRSLADARQWAQRSAVNGSIVQKITSYYCIYHPPPRPPRLHYAVQTYKELLLYVQQMSLSKDSALQDSAKVIHSNIFYHPEYRDVFITLLRNFYEVFQTRACLRDIIEATHVYFRQMERYSSQNGHMIVQERRAGKGRGRKRKGGKKGQDAAEIIHTQLFELAKKTVTITSAPSPKLDNCMF